MTTPPQPDPQQWQPMTPEQWHMQEQMLHLQQQQLWVQRQQAEMQRRNRGTAKTLIGLFVWTPLIIVGVAFAVWLITRVA